MHTDRSRTAIATRRFARATLACSSLAIAVALTSAPTRAQSFLGSSTTTFGNAVVTTGPNTTTITVNSPSAVIDWTPTDTATSPLGITWQPNGTTATFTGAANYAVLNRIVPVDPTRLIAFDGIVNSLVSGSPGGTVFFYSPGGIVLSINSQFNVGNLGLTSSAPVVDGAGNWFVGNQVQFQASDPGRAVNTLAGSQITAPAEGSFVALVAPSISNRGDITVNGQAALVSADAATITFAPSGLFDIQVTSGTSATGTTLFSDGNITGPASSGAGDNHRVYAVAVPKNTAITLAIGASSQLGFDVAGAADVVGNAVVLSAGRDILGGNLTGTRSAGGGSGASDLNIANTAVTSSLRGTSTDETFFFSIGGGTASTASTVNLQADTRATYTADGAGSVTTGNNTVTLISARSGNGVTGGQTDIFAINNGSLNITAGGASLNSQGFGSNGTVSAPDGANATGGIALISAFTGGTVSITGTTTVNAIGQGGAGFTGGGNGGVGTGGRAQIFVRDAGSMVTINGPATTFGGAFGGAGAGSGSGGAGIGGVALMNAQVAASNGLTITGAAVVTARGQGGSGSVGGVGIGGTSTAAASVNNTVNFNSTLAVDAQGTGGNGTTTGGTATGGTARLTLFQTGAINVASNATVNASGISGTGANGTGTSIGGLASVIAQQASVLDVNGGLTAIATGVSTTGVGRDASGGTAVVGATGNSRVDVAGVLRARADGVAGDTPSTIGAGGDGLGGNAQVFANTGGDVLANELNVHADGVGGIDAGSGAGTGTGGAASIFAGDAGSTITVNLGNSTGVGTMGDLDFVSAEGFGGVSNGGGSGVGGAATGGTAAINVINGAVLNGPTTGGTGGLIRILARGTAGGANTGATAGGTATAGTINIAVDNATMTSFNLLPSAFAQGGSALTGATGNIAGGNAGGGTRNISVVNGGSLTTAFPGGASGGQGGNGAGNGAGGNGSGGSATLLVDNNSTLNLTTGSAVFASGSGGTGGATGISGAAVGGNASARVANGSTLNMAGPTTNPFNINADANGFFNASLSAVGSASTGGTATFVIENATANLQTVNVTAVGTGGGGLVAQGGNGTGGSAVLQLIGATLNADVVTVNALGSGGSLDVGQSGVAGNGTGGLARIIATGGTSIATVATEIGIGAAGLGGNIGGAAGTTTGNGVGGRAALVVSNGASLTLNTPDVFIDADGEGGEVLSGVADFGGDGTGGQTDVFANGGTIIINGNLELEADNDGGEGLVGGDGLLRTDGIPNALIRAQNGSVTVTGLTTLASVGEGDSGGDARGGFLVVDALNSLAGPSAITLNGLVADAGAAGGQGIAAPSPTQTGGDGGDAFGGNIEIFGNAGNGTLILNGTSLLNALAFGGAGGTGHPGATGTAGGVGGDATGGNIVFGTKSGLDTGSVNTGSAQFFALQAQANAFGGAGGVGGSGTTQGVGGAGGDAQGGGVTLLVRGSPVTISGVLQPLEGNAVGGAGGAGSLQGAGGDATVGDLGGVGILATSRFMQPTQLGTLTAPTVSGTAFATGGAGSTAGTGNLAGSPLLLQFDGASGTVGEISLDATGVELPGAVPSLLSLTSGQLDLANRLIFQTTGTMTVALDRFVVNTPILTLRAANVVLPATAPVSAGTFNVSAGLGLFSDLDFLTFANFNVPFDTSFSWLGAFQVGNFTGGDFFVEAVGPITVGNIDGNTVELISEAALTTGAIVASEQIELGAGGTATTGQLTAGAEVIVSALGAVAVAGASAGIVNPSTSTGSEYNVGLRSQTAISAGDLTARGSVGVVSPGTISVGNIVTGAGPLGLGFLALAGTGLTTGSIDTTASTNGGQVYLANFSMEALGGQLGSGSFDPIPIVAATPVAIGGPIVLNGPVSTGRFRAATTGAFTAQAISAPNGFELAAGQSITLGDLSSFIVNVSSAQSLTTGAVTSTATAAQLAALNQTDGIILAAANGTLATGAIQAGGGVDLTASGSVTVGTVNAGTSIEIDAGQSVDGAGMTAGAILEVDAGGAIRLGNLTAGQSVFLDAGATLTAGSIVAGPDPISQFSMGLVATGDISLGNLTGSNTIGIVSETGSITAGNITAGRSLLALARGAVGLGGVTTGATANDFLYIANSSMVSLGGPINDDFNPAPIFAATPVATTGPITIAGEITTGNLIAATTGALTLGSTMTPASFNLPGRLVLASGGPLLLGSASASGIDLSSSGGSITAGGLQSNGRDLSVVAGGNVSLGNLTATATANSGGNPATDVYLGVASLGGSVTVGTVNSARDIGIAANGGGIVSGDLTATSDVLLLARDAVSVGSVSAAAENGRIVIANSSLFSLGGPVSNFNRAPIFTASLAPITGALTFNGAVTGSTLAAAANGNVTASALTLGQRINIGRAATAQVNGAWTAPTISLASQRLQFGTSTSAGIGGSGTTSLTLRALASQQTAVLGGTTAGMGYTLTQSDFGRIRTSNLTIQVDQQGVSSTAPDLEIRDLTLNGSGMSGGLSTVAIGTPGRARVTGDLLLQQAGAMDRLTVSGGQRLEIVLPDASLAITGTGGTLAGTLTLSSNSLVAGTLDLLMQVMADPEAAGLAEALARPASTTSNLEGYIRANGVSLISNANILLQNSGTARDFAGVTVGGGGLIIGRITPVTGGTPGGTTGGTTGGSTGGTTTTSGFSFTGMLVTANDVLMFQFTVDANSSITLRTYSYAGGTNAAGQVIPAGGFDPILALFDAAGALIGQNDDGGSNVPADPVTGARFDTFFQPTSPLAAGTYTVTVSAFPNFANGPNLSNGFTNNNSGFGSRTANFAFDVLGASVATGPGTQTPTGPSGPLNVIGFGRQLTATGSVTGEAFFSGINFGTAGDNPLVYTDLSQFNSCLVNGGTCLSPSLESDPVSSISSEIKLAIVNQLADAPVPDVIEEAADSATESADEEASQSAEEEDEAEADEASSPIAPPAPLINTRPLNPAVNVIEPVAGSGNPALIGSAVNEATAQGDTP